MAIMMMVFRLMVEKYFVRPLGSKWGLKETRKPYPRSNTVLEDAFRKSNSPKPGTVALLSKETNLSEIEVNQVLSEIDCLQSWVTDPALV